MSDFLGSIAQTNISFSEVNTITSVVGSNFYTPMIFINDTDAATNLTTPPAVNGKITLTASNFATETLSTLLGWCTKFFETNVISEIIVVVWDHAVSSLGGLTAAFNLWHQLGYQKFTFEDGASGATAIKLGQLCNADALLSQFWEGASDAGSIAGPATGILAELNGASPPVETVFVYSAQSGINPALAALGVALQTINSTGTPVGNKLSFNETLNVLASGTTGGTDNTNLTSTQQTQAATNKVNFFKTVGNNTGEVALSDSTTTSGNIADVQWVENYLNYVLQVQVAQYLTQTGATTFKTNETYQAILAILTSELQQFVQLGRLSNLQITNTPFNKLPATAGNNITIPNAWSALFNRTVTSVTVQGNVTISV